MDPTREHFHHPYQPYEIQRQFMTSLYRCIEDGKVGIFESPTGTGKSLSLICAALTWLREHKRQSWTTLHGGDDEDADDWLLQAEKAARRRELLVEIEEVERKLAAIRDQEAQKVQAKTHQRDAKKPRLGPGTQEQQPEDEFLLADYDSDNGEAVVAPASGATAFSSSTQALLDKLQKQPKLQSEDVEEDQLKLIICSRTHSQLTQFVNELRKVRPPSSIPFDIHEGGGIEESLKHLALGSRKTLCINPKVARLVSTAAINDQCLELQKPKTPKDKKCPYLPTKDDAERVQTFKDKAIAQIRDIEDIGVLGESMKVCPYYASRAAIATSEVLTLPYPLLLQKSAREALGVSVKGNVIIIDEAHNLMDAIADTFSVAMRLTQLEQAVRQVTFYASRFKNKLKGKNRVYITQVLRLLASLVNCLKSVTEKTRQQEVIITAAQLLSGNGVDQIKPHKLLQYLHESKLAHKVEGYSDTQDAGEHSAPAKGVLMQFQNFLTVLMNPDDEGRFFATTVDNDTMVRYTLLDPREHFRSIVQDARSVILAGGTMSPMSDYANYLFSYLDPVDLRTFSFGHVIPKNHLFAHPVTIGPSGSEFDFTYGKRSVEAMIVELGKSLIRICQVVPDGVVVFFPSYDYLAQVTACWSRLPASRPIVAELGEAKPIFQESKSSSVDTLLTEYALAISTGKGRGALMLAVIGGKLSEGINFSDTLGRAVVCVGLPFPNANGAEWKAKMAHIESSTYRRCKDTNNIGESDAKTAAKNASREFYENACMRAVNQAVGRAIRHQNDYAAVLLVDRRFATPRISGKLPGWIKESMEGQEQMNSWSKIEGKLRGFFEDKKRGSLG